MPRAPRTESPTGYYHVMSRGNGRMVIFSTNEDRRVFLRMVKRYVADAGVGIVAWCLMDNHVHMLVHSPSKFPSVEIHDVLARYAQYLNEKEGHIGHVFAGRFNCVPIKDEAQLLQTLRYIHRNPVEGGLSDDVDYKWSSYRDYLGRRSFTNTTDILALFDSIEDFVSFHRIEPDKPRGLGRIGNEEASRIAENVAKSHGTTALGVTALRTPERSEALREMKSLGLSIRQIERITGIGRNTVARA